VNSPVAIEVSVGQSRSAAAAARPQEHVLTFMPQKKKNMSIANSGVSKPPVTQLTEAFKTLESHIK